MATSNRSNDPARLLVYLTTVNVTLMIITFISLLPEKQAMQKKDNAIQRITLTLLLLLASLHPAPQTDARDLPEKTDINCVPKELAELYLYLAKYSSLTYQVPEEELIVAKYGCAVLVRMDADNNLIIAFRGSVSPFINRATIQAQYLVDLLRLRRYQDWFQTNVLQSLGFLPAQYMEAAELIVEILQEYPNASRIYITGHSKGGGVAEAAATVAWLSPHVPDELKKRIMAVTFNAAVIHAHNWKKFKKYYSKEDPVRYEAYLHGDAPRVDAVIMRDDVVPKIRWRDRRLKPFVNLVVISPTERMRTAHQHSIAVVIAELEKRLGIYQPPAAAPQHHNNPILPFVYDDPVTENKTLEQRRRLRHGQPVPVN